MSTNLQPQIDQADILIAKLQQIKTLWDEIPSEDELEDLAKQAGQLAGALESASETFQSDAFPGEEELEDLAKQAAGLAGALESVKETFASDDFPTEDALKSLTE
jgi:hypothetical protein